MKKPRLSGAVDVITGTAGRKWYISGMDYTDYLIIKFCVLVGIAFVYNVYKGFTGS